MHEGNAHDAALDVEDEARVPFLFPADEGDHPASQDSEAHGHPESEEPVAFLGPEYQCQAEQAIETPLLRPRFGRAAAAVSLAFGMAALGGLLFAGPLDTNLEREEPIAKPTRDPTGTARKKVLRPKVPGKGKRVRAPVNAETGQAGHAAESAKGTPAAPAAPPARSSGPSGESSPAASPSPRSQSRRPGWASDVEVREVFGPGF